MAMVEKELQQLRLRLKEIEWSSGKYTDNVCPVCGGYEKSSYGYHGKGHEPGCWLAEEINKTK